MTALAVTGPSDLRDQRWLDERIAAIEDGIEAVLDIARNWSDGRNLARLHGGSAQDYILGHVKHPLGRGVVVPLLTESNLSNRQIAAVAGVSRNTVNELAQTVPVDRPAETLGADGKLRAVRVPVAMTGDLIDPIARSEERALTRRVQEDLDQVLRKIERFQSLYSKDLVAGRVDERRRASTAKRLRRLGTHLGGIVWLLESLHDDDEGPAA